MSREPDTSPGSKAVGADAQAPQSVEFRTGGAGGDGGIQPKDVADLLSEEWDREWERKKSLEQRGITVITSSGALVTLVFAIVSTVTKGEQFGVFEGFEKTFLGLSLFCFISSAWRGIQTNRPEEFATIKIENLVSWLNKPDTSPGDPFIAKTEKIIEHARDVNDYKARLLRSAFTLQVMAVSFLAASVLMIMWDQAF